MSSLAVSFVDSVPFTRQVAPFRTKRLTMSSFVDTTEKERQQSARRENNDMSRFSYPALVMSCSDATASFIGIARQTIRKTTRLMHPQSTENFWPATRRSGKANILQRQSEHFPPKIAPSRKLDAIRLSYAFTFAKLYQQYTWNQITYLYCSLFVTWWRVVTPPVTTDRVGLVFPLKLALLLRTSRW